MDVYNFTLKTAPAIEPITLAEARKWLRGPESEDDDLIDRLIRGRREAMERNEGLALITQTWTLRFDRFPHCGEIQIKKRPVQSITSIKYLDQAGAQQTLTPIVDYQVDTYSFIARIFPAYQKSWPLTQCVVNAVEIEFKAGYGDNLDDVPQDLKDALLLRIADKYENREEMLIGVSGQKIDNAYDALVNSERIIGL